MARSKASARKPLCKPLPPRGGPTPRKMTARGFPPHFFKSQSQSRSSSQSRSTSQSRSSSQSRSTSQSRSPSQSQSRSPSPSSPTSGPVLFPPGGLSKPSLPSRVPPSPKPLAELTPPPLSPSPRKYTDLTGEQALDCIIINGREVIDLTGEDVGS